MAQRVTGVPRGEMGEEVGAMFDKQQGYGDFGSLLSAMALRPPIMVHVFGMLDELRADSLVPARYLELGVVVISKLNACTYCVSHHAPIMEKVGGLSEAAVADILNEDNPELDATDVLVVRYAKQLAKDARRVPDSLFKALREVFTEPQMVELTWRFTMCGAFNRFNDVMRLNLEVPAVSPI